MSDKYNDQRRTDKYNDQKKKYKKTNLLHRKLKIEAEQYEHHKKQQPQKPLE
jgi:hypothetical protein